MKKVYISENAYSEVKEYLKNKGFDIAEIKSCEKIDPVVGDHADLRVCRVCDSTVFASDSDIEKMAGKYPENASFCAVCLDRYLIHREDLTNDRLKEQAKRCGLEFINVNQGYTRCSCIVADGKSVITSDKGIYNKLKDIEDLSVLLISGEDVDLPGYDKGFIGGTCGRADGEIIFNGDISKHRDFEKIKVFLDDRGIAFKYFSKPLRDIGSVIAE